MSQSPLGNRDLMRAINRSIILNMIKTDGPIARAEVARRTRLSPATVTGITADLLDEDLIYEKETGGSSGGRRPILLALNPRGGFVIGVKLTEDHLSAALTDLEATVQIRKTFPLPNPQLDTVIEAFSHVVQDLLEEQHLSRGQLLGVGVGLAGIVDASRGVLRQSPILGWQDLPLADLLHKRLDVPVYIDNDVNTLTMNELWFGRGQGVNHFLVITLGRGVGAGVVIDGKLYQGYSGGAGEFGHFLIDPNGPPCACGKYGCLETYVADPSLIRTANERLAAASHPERVGDMDALIHLVSRGHPIACEVLRQAGELLGRNLANLVNLLVPQLIIISGEGVRSGECLFGPMRQALQTYVLPGLADDFELQVDVWDDYAWSRGAASLVLRRIFESPAQKETLTYTSSIQLENTQEVG
jgi:predicted NBD/HSP70 family sugar kinase